MPAAVRTETAGARLLAGFAALLVKLWSIQLKQGDYFRSIVPGTSELTVRVPGTRGEIKDVNGVSLVTNQASYEVIFNLKEIEDEYLRQHEVKNFSSYHLLFYIKIIH